MNFISSLSSAGTRRFTRTVRSCWPALTLLAATASNASSAPVLTAAENVSAPASAGAMLPSIIPAPVELRAASGGAFRLNAETRLVVIQPAAASDAVVKFLRELVGPATAVTLPLTAGDLSAENAIILNFDATKFPQELRTSTSTESYALTTDAHRVTIHAGTAAGAFYAVQTLRQLLPSAVERRALVKDVAWEIPSVAIRDEPRFAWRGLLLDVGRTFFTASEVKKFIDLMALQKMNVLHWHLTEDQGWRIEIKKYPRLTEVGAWREESPLRTDRKRGDGVRYGGFYTQEQIRDVVAYATSRFVTVMPEIELPGHAAAAITAYPELGNSDIPGYAPQVMTRWGVHPYTFAPKEETFAFIEDVLREVMALFPSRYIHIGGDEAPKTQWHDSPLAQRFIRQNELKDEHELQSRFIARIGKFLAANQRQLVGWDEIQEGGTPPGAVVMLWRTRPLKGADPSMTVSWHNLWAPLRAGHSIVLTPNSHLYLDYYQADPKTSLEPAAIGGLNSLEHVYSFEPPYAELTSEEAKRILGVEATFWSEFIWDFPKLQYMAFPRSSAVAEIAWSPRDSRNFAQFQARLTQFQGRLDELGVLYRQPGTIPLQVIR